MKERNERIDVLRGLCILIVVFGHAIQACLLEDETSFVWKVILSFQMPLLFLISGYSMGFTLPTYSNMFIIQKVKRLLVPYLTWMTVHYVLVCVIDTDYKTFSIIGLCKELIVSDFWFLRVLFCFFLVVWVCNYVTNVINSINKKWSRNVIFAVTLIGASLGVFLLSRILFLSGLINPVFWFYFISGWGLKKLLETEIIEKTIYKVQKIVFTLSLLAVGVISYIIACTNAKFYLSFVIVVAVFFSIYTCPILKEHDNKCEIINIGRNTLPVYAIHWCVLFSPLWRKGLYTSLLGQIILPCRVAIVFFSWIVLTFLLIKLLRRWSITRTCMLGK